MKERTDETVRLVMRAGNWYCSGCYYGFSVEQTVNLATCPSCLLGIEGKLIIDG